MYETVYKTTSDTQGSQKASTRQSQVINASERCCERLEPNEPMLSRAVDPRLRDAAWVRNEILGWRFYTELRATRTAPLREPQGLGGEPGLRESGDNLALALLSLFSNLDHQEMGVLSFG